MTLSQLVEVPQDFSSPELTPTANLDQDEKENGLVYSDCTTSLAPSLTTVYEDVLDSTGEEGRLRSTTTSHTDQKPVLVPSDLLPPYSHARLADIASQSQFGIVPDASLSTRQLHLEPSSPSVNRSQLPPAMSTS